MQTLTLPPAIPLIALAALLGLATYFDLTQRRIPNWLTLTGFAAGVALGTLQDGWGGGGGALLGGAVGFASFFLFYALGGMGAGDVKLMAAAGTFLGTPLVLWGVVCTAAAGGLLAMVRLGLAPKAIAGVAGNIQRLTLFWYSSRRLRRAEWLTLQRPEVLRIPYGAAIAAGCGFAALFPELSRF